MNVQRTPGPYAAGTAGDDGFQLACSECTVDDLINLAKRRNVTPRHVLSDVTKGTRRPPRKMGKTASDATGGKTWIWEISLNGGTPKENVSLGIKQPLIRVRIVRPRSLP